MLVEYDKLKPDVAELIAMIESKPHVRYIRYLLSKQVPPTPMRTELRRLGLSAPVREQMSIYFDTLMYPKLKAYGLAKYFRNYRNRLAGKDYNDNELTPTTSFDMTFEDNDAAREAFCKFLREIEIEEMWSREVTKYYGGVQNIPQNSSGERIMKANVTRSVEGILIHPRRYVIDKLLLEGVSISRISTYMLDKYDFRVDSMDLYAYRSYFFNFERKTIEETINQLISEQSSIRNEMEILKSCTDLTLGDKASIRKQYQEKLEFLDDTIKALSAKYSDMAYQQGIDDRLSVQEMIEDIAKRGYHRLKHLDRERDRDVVKPLTDVAKMVFTAVDKLSAIEERKTKYADKDKNVVEVLMELYKEAYDRNRQDAEERIKGTEDDDEIDIGGRDEV